MAEIAPPDPQLLQAIQLWEQYHQTCEHYDQTLAPNGIPTPKHFTLINKHAHQQYQEFLQKANDAGIPNTTIQKAKQHYRHNP